MMNVAMVLPAAGQGTRFGGDKLSRDLDGRPLLVRTVEIFTKREEVSQIIVAGPPQGFDEFSDRFGPVLGFHGAILVPGGERARWETVRAALSHVDPACTHVGVHDAARPCVSPSLLDRIFEAASQLDAVVPGIPLSSTLKEVALDQSENVAAADALADSILGEDSAQAIQATPVLRTVSRAPLVAAQTPQIFARALICEAYAQVDPEGATDDAEIVARYGQQVHVVDGDPRNLKVTRPEDLDMALAMIRQGLLR